MANRGAQLATQAHRTKSDKRRKKGGYDVVWGACRPAWKRLYGRRYLTYLPCAKKEPRPLCRTAGSPTDMWTEWNNRSLQVLDTHAPLRSCKQHKRRSVPWMDSQLLHLLSKRNRLHRKWLSDRSEQRYATFKAARREATTCNRKLKEAYYSTQFQLATCNVKQTGKSSSS